MNMDEAKIINHAITRYLARREHSYHELLQKLMQKGFSEAVCQKQLDLFVDKDLQSDSRFLEAFIRTAYHNGKGPNHIRQSLKQHQIESAEQETFVNNEEFDWFESAHRVRSKKFGNELPEDFTAKQKQMRFLQYRGFEQEHINEAFSSSSESL